MRNMNELNELFSDIINHDEDLSMDELRTLHSMVNETMEGIMIGFRIGYVIGKLGIKEGETNDK